MKLTDHRLSLPPTGFNCPLLLLYAERAVTARKRALVDAERHRRHMERVSEAMAQHDVEEAEAAFKVRKERRSMFGRVMGRDVCSSIHPYPNATIQCPMRTGGPGLLPGSVVGGARAGAAALRGEPQGRGGRGERRGRRWCVFVVWCCGRLVGAAHNAYML